MTSTELRKKFIEFFEKKGHVRVPSSSLVPDDPSVLLTTAGMQQFVPYFTGDADPGKDFKSRRVMSVQKSFRTVDIDEVGDETHLTFFQMLGHFSFGDYFKKETIEWTHEFATKILKVSPERISVTVFEGDDKIPFDKESYDTWSKYLPESQIRKGSREDNVWGPVGAEGICGAANEVYVDGMEVATLVFPEYYSDKDKNLTPLPQKGVDVGWGLERLAMIAQNKKSVFETDLFEPIISFLSETISLKSKRIIADHTRSIVFLISDKVEPSNKGAGSILRGLIRRVIVHLREFQFLIENEKPEDAEKWDTLESVAKYIVDLYKIKGYVNLKESWGKIESIIREEEKRFKKAYVKGRKKLVEYENQAKDNGSWVIKGDKLLDIYSTYGLPLEVVKDLVSNSIKLDIVGFHTAFKGFQEKSRAGLEKKFGGHGLLLDTGEIKAVDEEELKIVTRLHTATHLLQAALREVLGPEVKQNGSDITAKRTRFDFTFGRKLTEEEKQKVEDLVNRKIKEDLPVSFAELPIEEAKKTGALYFFRAKYGDRVKVYYMGNDLDTAWSREFCGGPHVAHTALVGRFKIQKEESASAGVRRIRGIVE